MLHTIWQRHSVSARVARPVLVLIALCACWAALLPLGAAAQILKVPGSRTVKDFTGACQVSVPAGWTEGKDFTLVREVPGVIASRFGAWMVPDMRFGLGKAATLSMKGAGHRYRERVARMDGTIVCAVQMERDSTPFTPAERQQLKDVGDTLEILP
jgi:hypothetical protein